MSDSLAAYYAELYRIEDDWYSKYYRDGWVLGTSLWARNLDMLREIDARFGVRPDDPRVYSVAAYLVEALKIDDNWRRSCRERGWLNLDPSTPEYREAEMAGRRAEVRTADCMARHFPGFGGFGDPTIDSVPKLWAYITDVLAPVAKRIHRMYPDQQGHRPATCDRYVQQVYSLLHELKVPWSPPPPYPAFTQKEAQDELRRIANRLEQDDAERCERQARQNKQDTAPCEPQRNVALRRGPEASGQANAAGGDPTEVERSEGSPVEGGEQVRGEETEPALSPLQYDILQALRSFKATDAEKRQTASLIAQKVGGDATEQACKAPIADLKRRGLVGSKTGRRGGTWLLAQGLELINRLRKS